MIAEARGYRVGHVPFEVLSDVPERPRPWLRQRLAWGGGQFRLFIVNVRFIAGLPVHVDLRRRGHLPGPDPALESFAHSTWRGARGPRRDT